jgi:hypothetical protein
VNQALQHVVKYLTADRCDNLSFFSPQMATNKVMVITRSFCGLSFSKAQLFERGTE